MNSFLERLQQSVSEDLSMCRALLPKAHLQRQSFLNDSLHEGEEDVSQVAGTNSPWNNFADDDRDDQDSVGLPDDLLRRQLLGEEQTPERTKKNWQFDSKAAFDAGCFSKPDMRYSNGTSGPKRCLPNVGDKVFGFQLLQELGHGAFARVFLARQGELADREVVLKISAIAGNEPQTLAQLQHTHIVPIYSVHDDPQLGLRAVCMPYFGGVSLSAIRQHLNAGSNRPKHGVEYVDALEKTQGPLPSTMHRRTTPSVGEPGDAEPANYLGRESLCDLRRMSYVQAVVWTVAKLADGLQHAHDRGVLHRDIKPSNVVIAADGQPLLLDFNVSEEADGDPFAASIGGTIAYMAPEHLKAMLEKSLERVRQVDCRSDVYSLGLVLFELLAGTGAFEQTCTYSVPKLQIEAMYLERSRQVPSLRSRGIDVPWSLESIVRKALSSASTERYQTAAQLAQDLQCFLDDRPLKFAPELSRCEQIRKWTRRHPRFTSVALVTMVAVSILASVSLVLSFTVARLDQTLGRLTEAQARESAERFRSGKNEALCLLNTVADGDSYLHRGIASCERTLELFKIQTDRNWQQSELLSKLPSAEQSKIAEDARELLLLLADGRVRLHLGNRQTLTEALQLVDQAEAIGGIEPSRALWTERARYLNELGAKAEAEQARSHSDTIIASTSRDFYLLAAAHARQGTRAGYRKAIDELNLALKLDSQHYWSWFQRGLCHQELGESLMAASDFSMCTGLQPEFAWGHFNRGYVFDQSGKKLEAIAAYTQTLHSAPDFAPAYVNRGVAYLELKQFADAHADFLQARSLGRQDSTVLAGIAMALEGLRRHSEADTAFASLLNQVGELPFAVRQRLRWTYGFAVSKRLPQSALDAFEAVLAEDPDNIQSLYGVGMLEMNGGSTKWALATFARALEMNPGFAPARRYRAILLARNGAIEAAVREINICLERDPTSGETLYAAACVMALSLERTATSELKEQAVDFLQRAAENGKRLDEAGHDPDLRLLRSHPRFRSLVPGEDGIGDVPNSPTA